MAGYKHNAWFGQSTMLPNNQGKKPRRRVCGAIFEHPADWKLRSGATICQAVLMFICVMFMASLQFHWGIAKGALLDSPLISVGWAATVLLLWNFIITTMQERYDYFTRWQHSRRYRPRRRLVVWESIHFVFSAALFAGWTVLLCKAECADTREPGCAVAIATDAILGIFVAIELCFVVGLCHYDRKGRRLKEKRPRRYHRNYEMEISDCDVRVYSDEEMDLSSIASKEPPKRQDRGQYIQNHHDTRQVRSKPSSTTSRSTRSAPGNGTRTGIRKVFQERGDFPPGAPSSGTFPKKSHLYPTSTPYSATHPGAVLPSGPPPQPGMGPPSQQSMRPGIPQQGPPFFN